MADDSQTKTKSSVFKPDHLNQFLHLLNQHGLLASKSGSDIARGEFDDLHRRVGLLEGWKEKIMWGAVVGLVGIIGALVSLFVLPKLNPTPTTVNSESATPLNDRDLAPNGKRVR